MSVCILLNGPSLSGKSSISKAIREIEPAFSVIDLKSFQKLSEEVISLDTPLFDPEVIKELVRNTSISLACDMADLTMSLDFDAIIEGEFTGPEGSDSLDFILTILEGHDVLMIGVTCSEEEIAKRAKELDKPAIGIGQLKNGIHENKPYIHTIDTTGKTPQESAQELIDFFMSEETENIEPMTKNDIPTIDPKNA